MPVDSRVSDQMGIGVRVAQRLTSALSGHGIPYDELVKIVYGEFQAIGDEAIEGDWIEFPNGTTYELVYKPKGA